MGGATERTPLATATTVVGLLAGVAAGLYVLGGLTLGLRLLFDGFSIESIVGLVGQLPETLVITASLVSVGAPMVLVGIAAAATLALLNKPRKRTDLPHLSHSTVWGLALLAVILVSPAIVLAIVNYGLSPWLATSAIGFVVTYLVVIRAWYGLRQVGHGYGSHADRALLGAALWMAMTLVPAIMLGAALKFDNARACTKEPDGTQDGLFVGQTSDHVFLASDVGREQKIVSVPAGRITLLTYGDSPEKPECPVSAGP